jgi:Predicted membrane protein (DUF2157)
MVERLSHWKDEGIITPVQFERLGAIVRKDRFSVSLELNALLYIGVLSIAAGLLWTVRTHFTALGDTAVVAALTVIVALCFGYCFARAQPYSPREVVSPTAIFDYVLYLGCLVFAIELAYLETRFTLLGDSWDAYILVSAIVFFAAAYRFDNRFVLSLALSTLAAWFGFKLTQFGFRSAESLRVSALVYGVLVAGMAAGLRRVDIKPHFVETHLHIAATAAFVALASGTWQGDSNLVYLAGLLALAAVSIAYGIRHRQFAFVAYGALYPYVGLSLRLTRHWTDMAVLGYGVVSASAMAVLMVIVAHRFGRDA